MAKKRSNQQRLRALERRLTTLEREHADLAKRTKKLSKRVERLPDPEMIFGAATPGEGGVKRFEMPFPGPGGPGGPNGPNLYWRRPGGGPPWRKQFGPVV